MRRSIVHLGARRNPLLCHRLSIVGRAKRIPPYLWGVESLMGGRHFSQYNKADPEPVVRLLAQRPQCFGASDWRLYLLDVHRGTLNDPANRQRLVRGVAPNYCEECTQGYRASMQARGRCHPHPDSLTSVGDANVSPSPAARAADEASSVAPCPDAAGEHHGATGLMTRPLQGNAQSGVLVPVGAQASAGLLEVA